MADENGYRVVTPGESIEIFAGKTGSGDESGDRNDIEDGDHHANLQYGRLTPWGELYFPKGCGYAHLNDSSRTPGSGTPNIIVVTKIPQKPQRPTADTPIIFNPITSYKPGQRGPQGLPGIPGLPGAPGLNVSPTPSYPTGKSIYLSCTRNS